MSEGLSAEKAESGLIASKGASVAALSGDFPSGRLVLRCEAPAPLVANGAPFVGCSKEQGHEGDHEVTVRWAR